MWYDPRQALFFAIVIGLTFIAMRGRHYLAMRSEGHDRYEVVASDLKRCPDMDMFGFKFSVIMALVVLNLFLTIYLIATSR